MMHNGLLKQPYGAITKQVAAIKKLRMTMIVAYGVKHSVLPKVE
jgi:hypothetical protein